MAIASRVTRVANPRRGRARRRNARRKLSAKQIMHFGTKRQRAALKSARKRKRTRAGSAANPKRRRSVKRRNSPRVRVIYRTKANPRKRARRRRSNPALLVTLGSVNPKRRTSKMATRRRRRRSTNRRRRVSNPRRRTRRVSNVRRARRRRTNRRRTVVVANPHHRRRYSRRRRRATNRRRNGRRHYRRNPSIFGRSSGKDLFKMAGGVLAGVAVTKLIPGWVPASIASSIPSGGVMAVIVSAASAFVTGFALSKVDPEFGQAAYLGGFAQTISVAMNAFLPSSISGTFSLGDLVNGNFVVPQNPLRGMSAPAMVASAPAARGMSAYPSAY